MEHSWEKSAQAGRRLRRANCFRDPIRSCPFIASKFNMPVVYYSQLMTVAYGGSAQQAGLDGQLIRAEKLEKIAGK